MNEWIKCTTSVKYSSVHLQILRNPPVCPTGGIKCLICETILPHQPELQHAGNSNSSEVTPRTKFLFSGSVIQNGSKYNINPLNLQLKYIHLCLEHALPLLLQRFSNLGAHYNYLKSILKCEMLCLS